MTDYPYDFEDDPYAGTSKSDLYVEALLDHGDDLRKQARMNGVRNPLVVEWEREERASAEIFGRCEYRVGHGFRCLRAEGHESAHYLACEDES